MVLRIRGKYIREKNEEEKEKEKKNKIVLNTTIIIFI